MISETPKIAIQLVTYWSQDGKNDIERCLHSLERLKYEKGKWALVIVDNPSPDGSATEYIQREWLPKVGSSFPEIFFVKNDENTGFSGGHNRAYDESKKWGADMVYLLNQDAMMDRNALREVVKYSVSNSNNAIVQSRLMLHDRPELLNSCGNCLHFLGFGFSDGSRKKPNDVQSKLPHFYASGAATLISVNVIEEIGGLFDSSYFMYHEDIDLSWRTRLAGYKIGYAENSVVYHRYEFSRSVGKFFWMERNRFITHFAHLKLPTLILIAPMMLFLEFGSVIFAIKSGWFGTKIGVYRALFSSEVKEMAKSRRKLSKSIRKVSDRKMLKEMVGAIYAQEVDNVIMKYMVNPMTRVYFAILKLIVWW